ncbi:hypothetical protein OEZ85_011499 [Tetradesmus obliquus]|uniref:Uncharacterized protein n=1 Tax=Tetradesmus obliquus TaxID=3088 RepID=A0ABY8TSL9_TETOB|nr:hypothetical protein OEZ85_011499 [Tetradesmus obliquus]
MLQLLLWKRTRAECPQPYCVVLLKNNAETAPDTNSTSPDPYNNSNQSHTLCASGPLALLTWPSPGNAGATSGYIPVAAVSAAADCSWAGLPQPAAGPQVQHTNIVEQCSQPMWDALMQLHVANKDALLRLQAHSSTSTYSTLEWFTCLAQSRSANSKPAHISDPCLGQVLSDAAVIGGLRPAAVRLALLQKLLMSWQPDQSHLQALLDLSLPLLVADRQRLLTAAEAAALHDAAGCLMDAAQQLISCHYDDGSWQQDAMRTAAAARVVLEELERDVQLQAGLPQQLQLPLIGLHVRYSLLHSHVKSLLTCGHDPVYDAATRGLEAAVRQLHDQLLQQGWAALSVEGSKERSGAAAVLPERDAAGNLPCVILMHTTVPVWWDLFVHLQVLVDQVMDVAIKPVRSYSRRAATARQLFGITTAAVEQYAAHLHAAATGLLRVSQVVLAPSSVVQSGKTARHRRGESFGSPATSR